MKIINCEQLSPQWNQARCGIPSASNFDKIITTLGQPSKQRTKYMYRLAGESITKVSEESYQNLAMLRGIELEQEARTFYEIITGTEVKQVGFCITDGYGCSPDGFVGEYGVIEIKSPILSTHVEYLLENNLPTDYIQQVQGELLVTGRKFVDFISYYPGIKPMIIRVNRDESFIRALRNELDKFCKELEQTIKRIGD